MQTNPFISFCVYVAARVFVQYLRTRPNDQQMHSSLQFLLQAMQALRRKNPLTESFLVQLDLDLEGAGISKPYMPVEKKDSVIPVNSDSVGCTAIYEIRDTQDPKAPINQFLNSRTSSTNAAPQFSRNNNQQPPAFGSLSGSGIEIAPQPAPFMPVRNVQELSQDFSPHRGAVPGASTFIFNENNTHDMDLSGDQPSPSTINSQSRGGSTSHSSYSPGQQAEQQLPYRASPRFASSQMRMSKGQPQTQSSSTAPLAPLFPSNNTNNNTLMEAYSSEAINSEAYENGFDWEFSAMGGEMNMGQEMEAGITPGTWNSMLESVMESVPMGWDVLGTPHGANIDVPGAAQN
mgnify:CR=1 FL=1